MFGDNKGHFESPGDCSLLGQKKGNENVPRLPPREKGFMVSLLKETPGASF